MKILSNFLWNFWDFSLSSDIFSNFSLILWIFWKIARSVRLHESSRPNLGVLLSLDRVNSKPDFPYFFSLPFVFIASFYPNPVSSSPSLCLSSLPIPHLHFLPQNPFLTPPPSFTVLHSSSDPNPDSCFALQLCPSPFHSSFTPNPPQSLLNQSLTSVSNTLNGRPPPIPMAPKAGSKRKGKEVANEDSQPMFNHCGYPSLATFERYSHRTIIFGCISNLAQLGVIDFTLLMCWMGWINFCQINEPC